MCVFRPTAFVSLLLVCAHVAAADGTDKSRLTLESIFVDGDFVSERIENLQWSDDGRSFTYTRRDPDSDLLHVVERRIDGSKERVLLRSSALTLDGEYVRLSGYQWGPKRRVALIAGPKSRTWDSVMEAPHYVYETKTQKLTALADGNSHLRNVHLSPDGQRVGYVLDNDLYVYEIGSRENSAVTTDGSSDVFNGIFDYGSIMFGFTDAWHWSPDSRKMAFWRLDVTDVKVFWMIDELGKYPEVRPLKYPNTDEKHAVNQIGVYHLDDGKTVWMDIGDNADDYIPKIDWAPDSKSLAIQRLTRDHDDLALLWADAATGNSEVIVTDHDPAWIDVTTDLTFLQDSPRFVWTSEKSGHRHAYLYDYAGKETQLTSGDWSIMSLIGVDETDGWLYFYAKKDSLIDQLVYRVKLGGSEVERVSGDAGWYDWNLSPNGKHVIEEYSTAAQPPRYSIREAGGTSKHILIENQPRGFEKFDVPMPEFFQFETDDGATLNAFLIKPTGFDSSKRYPVIAYGYGNAGSQMVVNRWGGPRGVQRDMWHRYMADQGYVIFSMDNRTTTGRGKKAKNMIYGHYAKWAVLDQLKGVDYLRTLDFVDADRLGFWGWSGGGYLTAAMMTKGAPNYQVGVSVAPVIDLTRYQAVGVERWMGQLDEHPEGYEAVNLINFADRLEGDLLLIHGTGDENVKFAFTLQFADALIKAGKQFDMMVYPNEHHGIEGARQHVYTKIADYFKEKL